MKVDDFLLDDDPTQQLVGPLAHRFGLVSRRQLADVLEAWKASGGSLPLGEFMFREQLITDEQLDQLLQIQALLHMRYADRQFAEMVLETRYVSRDEVEYAFSAQEAAFRRDRTLRRIGELLVEFGAIDKELFDTLLVQQGRTRNGEE